MIRIKGRMQKGTISLLSLPLPTSVSISLIHPPIPPVVPIIIPNFPSDESEKKLLPTRDILNKLTVKELRGEFKLQQIPLKGLNRKDQLIDKYLDVISSSSIPYVPGPLLKSLIEGEKIIGSLAKLPSDHLETISVESLPKKIGEIVHFFDGARKSYLQKILESLKITHQVGQTFRLSALCIYLCKIGHINDLEQVRLANNPLFWWYVQLGEKMTREILTNPIKTLQKAGGIISGESSNSLTGPIKSIQSTDMIDWIDLIELSIKYQIRPKLTISQIQQIIKPESENLGIYQLTLQAFNLPTVPAQNITIFQRNLLDAFYLNEMIERRPAYFLRQIAQLRKLGRLGQSMEILDYTTGQWTFYDWVEEIYQHGFIKSLDEFGVFIPNNENRLIDFFMLPREMPIKLWNLTQYYRQTIQGRTIAAWPHLGEISWGPERDDPFEIKRNIQLETQTLWVNAAISKDTSLRSRYAKVPESYRNYLDLRLPENLSEEELKEILSNIIVTKEWTRVNMLDRDDQAYRFAITIIRMILIGWFPPDSLGNFEFVRSYAELFNQISGVFMNNLRSYLPFDLIVNPSKSRKLGPAVTPIQDIRDNQSLVNPIDQIEEIKEIEEESDSLLVPVPDWLGYNPLAGTAPLDNIQLIQQMPTNQIEKIEDLEKEPYILETGEDLDEIFGDFDEPEEYFFEGDWEENLPESPFDDRGQFGSWQPTERTVRDFLETTDPLLPDENSLYDPSLTGRGVASQQTFNNVGEGIKYQNLRVYPSMAPVSIAPSTQPLMEKKFSGKYHWITAIEIANRYKIVIPWEQILFFPHRPADSTEYIKILEQITQHPLSPGLTFGVHSFLYLTMAPYLYLTSLAYFMTGDIRVLIRTRDELIFLLSRGYWLNQPTESIEIVMQRWRLISQYTGRDKFFSLIDEDIHDFFSFDREPEGLSPGIPTGLFQRTTNWPILQIISLNSSYLTIASLIGAFPMSSESQDRNENLFRKWIWVNLFEYNNMLKIRQRRIIRANKAKPPYSDSTDQELFSSTDLELIQMIGAIPFYTNRTELVEYVANQNWTEDMMMPIPPEVFADSERPASLRTSPSDLYFQGKIFPALDLANYLKRHGPNDLYVYLTKSNGEEPEKDFEINPISFLIRTGLLVGQIIRFYQDDSRVKDLRYLLMIINSYIDMKDLLIFNLDPTKSSNYRLILDGDFRANLAYFFDRILRIRMDESFPKYFEKIVKFVSKKTDYQELLKSLPVIQLGANKDISEAGVNPKWKNLLELFYSKSSQKEFLRAFSDTTYFYTNYLKNFSKNWKNVSNAGEMRRIREERGQEGENEEEEEEEEEEDFE